MICQRCGKGPLLAVVRVSIRMPMSLLRRLTKAALRRKDVSIEAADWARLLLECQSCHAVWRSEVALLASVDRPLGREDFAP